ncbi:SDR family oxidoreductase [Mycolicibacterium septicum]|uniref:SDR family oxidoreductase n=1 Tax=Mycolicibacterium septicum TaxID=98668 RepID=UPI0023619170|nr:SDR family oxidoreductase [Mycolicibacterium septicum]
MDLGIAGRRAVVCASSQGLGRACAEALAAEGVNVVVNGRDRGRLEQTSAELRSVCGVEVVGVAADITTAAGRTELLGACPAPDILVTNNAGPKPGGLFDVTDDELSQALVGHYLAPLALVRAVVPGMRQRRFGRIVNITSAMVTTPNSFMAASSGARTALTAVMKGLSKEVVGDNVTINQLQPERIDTGRQLQMAKLDMERNQITFEEARARQVASIPAQRLGQPEEFAAACAFLCSRLRQLYLRNQFAPRRRQLPGPHLTHPLAGNACENGYAPSCEGDHAGSGHESIVDHADHATASATANPLFVRASAYYGTCRRASASASMS